MLLDAKQVVLSALLIIYIGIDILLLLQSILLTTCLPFYAAYCVVAKDTVGKQISIAFLERMKADFKKRYGGGKADTAIAKSLNKEFGYVHSMLLNIDR